MTTTITTLHVDDTGPLADAIVDTLVHRIGKDAANARPHDWLAATILTVRNDIIERWMASTREAHAAGQADLLSQPGVPDRAAAA